MSWPHAQLLSTNKNIILPVAAEQGVLNLPAIECYAYPKTVFTKHYRCKTDHMRSELPGSRVPPYDSGFGWLYSLVVLLMDGTW